MYDRRVAGRTLRFGHTGMLSDDAFVLYDRATDSYWVQATGEATSGPLRGQRLRLLPASVNTWAEWKARHPGTTVLPGRRARGFMGEYEGATRPDLLGLAVVVRLRAKLYPFAALARQPVLNDTFGGVPLVVAYVAASGTAAAWGRELDGRVLTFAPAGATGHPRRPLLRDAETDSTWSALSGEAVAGPLRGRALATLTHHPIRTGRFAAFYPEAPVYGAR